MMLRSLALIRHSVLSRSVGLHTVSQTRQRCSGVNKGRSAGVNASKTRPLTEHVNTAAAAAAALFGHVRTDETRGHVGLTPAVIRHMQQSHGEQRASPVDEHGGRVGPRGLQVGHGVPLVDAALLRGDAALVEGHPREGDAPWEVVEAAGHLACLVEDLQGRPAEAQRPKLIFEQMDAEQQGKREIKKEKKKILCSGSCNS